MAENKTKPTSADVGGFLDAVPNEQRRADGKRICAMMERLSGEPPVLWGPSIVGFGHCRYRHDSGREGEMPRIGFSPRASELVLYLTDDYSRHQALMDRLGKHRTGKSCLYVKKLSDVDEAVLEALIADTLAHTRKKYPEGA
jgi:hypothetical protein